MSDKFYDSFLEEFDKVASSKGHSAGMLGALIAAGLGGAAGYKRGFLGRGGAKTRGSHGLVNAALSAPLGYVAGRGIHGIASSAKKHTKNLAKGEDKE